MIDVKKTWVGPRHHSMVLFENGARVCSCRFTLGEPPNLRAEEDKVLASIIRKMMADKDAWDSPFMALEKTAVCFDGWVDLEPEQVEALRRLR